MGICRASSDSFIYSAGYRKFRDKDQDTLGFAWDGVDSAARDAMQDSHGEQLKTRRRTADHHVLQGCKGDAFDVANWWHSLPVTRRNTSSVRLWMSTENESHHHSHQSYRGVNGVTIDDLRRFK